MNDISFITRCYIKSRINEENIISGTVKGNILTNVSVRLDGYAIIPLEDYNNLILSKE